MENLRGYARVLGQMRIAQQLNKSLFRKPYLKYGQCCYLWSYFLQLGGILGAKHAANLDAFGDAFLGMTGPPAAMKKWFADTAKPIAENLSEDSMKFWEFVGRKYTERIGYAGDAQSYLLKHGTTKVPASTAAVEAWGYSVQGAALGVLYPHVIRRMFEQTHRPISKASWNRAVAAGLAVPAEQNVMSYEEAEEAENKAFIHYCRECRQDLYPVLSGTQDKVATLVSGSSRA